MLVEAQRRLIATGGITTIHDHEVVSLTAGEPFLEGCALCYFDGRSLSVCGQPLRGRPAPTEGEMRATLEHWLQRTHVEYLTYLGPAPMRFPRLARAGFELVIFEPRQARAAELFLEVGRLTASQRRLQRRATRCGFTCKWRRGSGVTHPHLALVETFFRDRPLTDYLKDMALALPAVLRRDTTVLLEAWHGESLQGFVAVHQPFAGILVGLFLARQPGHTGVGDFLYSQLLDYAASVGAELVNLGPSPTERHFAFKRKWGGEPLVPPYYACTWRHPGCRAGNPRSWMRRVLRLS